MNVVITAIHTDYIENTTATERGIVTRLLRAALANGYTVSVYDGEEWTLRNSKRIVQIMAALATTGEDVLQFRDSEGFSIGKVWLIWGNDEDLISDHSDSDTISSLVRHAQTGA